ncbi:MAG: phosphotransferase [Xanthomonadales bacterium]|nr:phosphotransferase [Xanthomonadales bacterium]
MVSAREQQRQRWLQATIGNSGWRLEQASSDAGYRSYWRLHQADGDSVIVMDSPPELEDVRPWLAMHTVLAAAGVRVPGLLAADADADAGFLLLEDLGRHTYLHLLDADNADALFGRAVEQLLRLQAITPPPTLPRYDAALLKRELDLFGDWFLGRHLGLALSANERAMLAATGDRLIESALAQAQVLVHRDFMPRNLMPTAGCLAAAGRPATETTPTDTSDGPAVIDFQDAVLGPVAYDPICLFRDAFISWPAQRVDGWLRDYHARASRAGIPVPADADDFLRAADWIGIQRHLKVLGIFARLHHRDHKPRYLADAGRFIVYLEQALAPYPELAALAAFLQQRVKPALAPATQTETGTEPGSTNASAAATVMGATR